MNQHITAAKHCIRALRLCLQEISWAGQVQSSDVETPRLPPSNTTWLSSPNPILEWEGGPLHFPSTPSPIFSTNRWREKVTPRMERETLPLFLDAFPNLQYKSTKGRGISTPRMGRGNTPLWFVLKVGDSPNLQYKSTKGRGIPLGWEGPLRLDTLPNLQYKSTRLIITEHYLHTVRVSSAKQSWHWHVPAAKWIRTHHCSNDWVRRKRCFQRLRLKPAVQNLGGRWR